MGEKRLHPIDVGHWCTSGCGIITQSAVVQLSTSLWYERFNERTAVFGFETVMSRDRYG